MGVPAIDSGLKLIFVTSYLFIEMYNIKMYLETNENQLNNLVDDINISAKSRWPLDKEAPYMKGPGLKL